MVVAETCVGHVRQGRISTVLASVAEIDSTGLSLFRSPVRPSHRPACPLSLPYSKVLRRLKSREFLLATQATGRVGGTSKLHPNEEDLCCCVPQTIVVHLRRVHNTASAVNKSIKRLISNTDGREGMTERFSLGHSFNPIPPEPFSQQMRHLPDLPEIYKRRIVGRGISLRSFFAERLPREQAKTIPKCRSKHTNDSSQTAVARSARFGNVAGLTADPANLGITWD